MLRRDRQGPPAPARAGKEFGLFLQRRAFLTACAFQHHRHETTRTASSGRTLQHVLHFAKHREIFPGLNHKDASG